MKSKTNADNIGTGDIRIDEIMPKLFSNWLQLPFEESLDEIGEFVKLKQRDTKEYGKYPVVDQGEDLINGYIDDENLLYTGELPVIIFGDHTRRVKFIDFPFAVGADGTKIFKPRKFFDEKFFNYYLNSLKITSEGYSRHYKFLKAIKVPLPPLAEQQRIVEKLDALMIRINNCKTRLEKIPTLLKNFRQSVLAAAVSGELTKKWRESHQGIKSTSLIELNQEREKLQRNSSIRKGQKSFRYKQPVEIEIGGRTKGVDQLFDLPETWKWVALDSVAWSISDGPHFSPPYVAKENGFHFISSRNVSYSSIDFSDAKFVAKENHLEFIKRGKPEIGDVLLTKGGTTGIAHTIKTEIEFSIWVHVALLKLVKKIIVPEYLRDVLTSDFLYRQSQAQTHGVGNQDLGLTRMIFMTIPLPPLEEQKEIVSKVEELFHFADSIEAHYQKAKAWVEKLPQSILAKAFRGELVKQNENDEPASKFLNRIKEEKQQIIKTSSTSKRAKMTRKNRNLSLMVKK
jgi:type I restriction enzyme, S subunit